MTNRIKDLRKERKITQAAMARDLGVAISTIQNWESERTEMTGYSLLMVADYFGVTPSEVYGSGTPDVSAIEEQELLTYYRACSKRGREQVREYASFMAKEHPKSDEPEESVHTA